MPVKLDLVITNCRAKANIRVEKRSRSPEQSEQTVPAKRFCHQPGVALNLTPDYTRAGLYVRANIQTKNIALESLKETVEYNYDNEFSIDIPKLFAKIYDNDIEDLKPLKHNKDFQKLCLELKDIDNNYITHFIADYFTFNNNYSNLL